VLEIQRGHLGEREGNCLVPLFLLTYWKPIAAGLVALALLGGVAYIFHAGKQSERARQAQEVIHDIEKANRPVEPSERSKLQHEYRRRD
jgi:hypothetical protein